MADTSSDVKQAPKAERGFDLGRLVDETLRLFTPLLLVESIDLRREVSGGLIVDTARGGLGAALRAMLLQSMVCLSAAGPDRVLVVRARREAEPGIPGGHRGVVSVEVLDNAPRLTEELRRRWRDTLPGRSSLEAGGGRVDLCTEAGGLLGLRITLSEAAGIRARPRIFVVDDLPDVLDLVDCILTRRGFETVRFADAYDALLALTMTRCDLLLLDLNMPKMNGPMLFGAISAQLPDLASRTIIMSGAVSAHRRFIDDNALPVIRKPFAAETLIHAVTSLLASVPELIHEDIHEEEPLSPIRAPGAPHSLLGARALVLTQSPATAIQLEKALREHGLGVEKLSNGFLGLIKIRKERFELMVLELVLPGCDGMKIVRAVAREMPEMLVRFIVIGGSAERYRTALEELGVSVLPGPILEDSFVALVKAKTAMPDARPELA